jgi:hypothetical protein
MIGTVKWAISHGLGTLATLLVFNSINLIRVTNALGIVRG